MAHSEPRQATRQIKIVERFGSYTHDLDGFNKIFLADVFDRLGSEKMVSC